MQLCANSACDAISLTMRCLLETISVDRRRSHLYHSVVAMVGCTIKIYRCKFVIALRDKRSKTSMRLHCLDLLDELELSVRSNQTPANIFNDFLRNPCCSTLSQTEKGWCATDHLPCYKDLLELTPADLKRGNLKLVPSRLNRGTLAMGQSLLDAN